MLERLDAEKVLNSDFLWDRVFHLKEGIQNITFDEEVWTPDIPIWQAEYDEVNSPGAKARELWERNFQSRELDKIKPENCEVLFTGIGDAVAQAEDSPKIRRFGDGLEVPDLVDLEEKYGKVPELLFLVASPLNPNDLLLLVGTAREYKEQYQAKGLKGIVIILTAMPHERQDHKFTDPATGRPMNQVTTLKDVVNLLANSDIDGAINIGGHSLRATELALRHNFPLLPIDPTDWLMKISGFDQIPPEQRFVVGPDKGRRGTARKLAQWLGCPLAAAKKVRERMKEGYPKVTIAREALEYIRKHNCIVIILDDEIREGGTMGELTKLIGRYAKEIRICVLKGICAAKGNITAIDHLGHKKIKEVVMTDAVRPICDPGPIKNKLRVVSLKPEIMALIDYLKAHLIPDGPGWLQDPAVSLLKLDLTVAE